MPELRDDAGQALVLAGEQRGITIIPQPTPLTRLHYFDGKFLRAADLELEQRYLRRAVELANLGGGAGVVHGLDTTLAGDDRLRIGAGLAVDPDGGLLLLPGEVTVGIQELIE